MDAADIATLLVHGRDTVGVIAQKRAAWCRKWTQRALELREEENNLKCKLAPHLRSLLSGKRLMLWREMLAGCDYPDMEVFDELVSGTALTGPVPATGIFEATFKPASMTESQLKQQARASRVAIINAARTSGDPSVDEEVYAKTLVEKDHGWLVGPIEVADLPDHAIVSRRFGLKQGAKVRLIDDFSGSGVNSTVQACESPKPHSTDVVAALLLQLARSTNGGGMLGKCFDLCAAYRQMGVHPSSLWASFVVVFNPHLRCPQVFALRALPFGATRSVHSFLRVAHSLYWIGASSLALCWTVFFDDFVTLTPPCLASSTEMAVDALFRLTGWKYATEGDKCLPFSTCFSALGITVNLEHIRDGWAEFGNTAKRRAELGDTLEDVCNRKRLTVSEALRLRGRMQFADGQIFGRASRLCLREVDKHVFETSGSALSDDSLAAISRFACLLREGAPRKISIDAGSPWLLFTDACYEKGAAWACGLGGVLFGPTGELHSFFSHCLNDEQREALGELREKTIIFEAELLSVCIAFALWSRLFAGHPIVCYVDNNAVRDVLISGRGRSNIAKHLVEVLLNLEDSHSVLTWIARVPSPSNVSDGPSRGSTSELEAQNATCCNVENLLNILLNENSLTVKMG